VQYIYNPIGKVSKGAAKLIRLEPKAGSKMLTEGAMEHINSHPKNPKEWVSNWDHLHKTIGFDVGLTFVYAILHELAYKHIAAIGWKKKDKNAATADEHPDAAASATESADPTTLAAAAQPASVDDKSFTATVKPSKKPEKSGNLFVEQLAAKQETATAQPSL
jgi:hypothetical protein